jgi:hypothetical protein
MIGVYRERMILQLLIASHEELNVQLIEEEAQIGVA